MTSAERWAAVQSVLDSVLELPAPARTTQIAVLCDNDTELQDEVERLVRACTAAEADITFLRDAAQYASPVVADLESGADPPADADELRSRVALALEQRYVLEHELGRGGMAIVFMARDLRHQRQVAVKLMKPGLLAGVLAERFLREVRIVAGLTHPHILPLYDSGEAAGLLYHVSAYIEGESLRARLRREGALPVRDVLRIMRDIASALDYAHSRGIVHRDIKPENVLLQGGHAVVADFGIARAFGHVLQDNAESDAAAVITREGLRLGTPAYMAPEQAAGNPSADLRADLYALGLVAHEMLSGTHPFSGNTPEELLSAQLTRVPARLVRPDVPTALADVVQRLLAKRPEDRFQSADQLLGELERITGEELPGRRGKLLGLVALARRRRGAAAEKGKAHVRRRLTRGLIVAGTLVLLTALLLVLEIRPAWVPAPQVRQPGAPLSEKTVAVAAFSGSGGRPSEAVDRVLQMAADWITQGLTQTGLVTVVPVGPLASGVKAGPAGDERAVLEAARAAGAGLVLLPSYNDVGDTVFLSLRILRVPDAVILRSVGPVRATLSTPLEGAETLRQRSMAALATLVDERLAHWSSAASQPTSFEAYQAFAEGLTAFFDASQERDPIPLFRRAHALDTTFTAPLLWALFRAGGEIDDSLKSYLNARISRLPPWDRSVLGFHVRQNPEEGYQAFRSVVELAPQSEWLYMLAWTAMATNRPAVAVRALQRLDPDRGWMRYWPSYWVVLMRAHHHLKQYDLELESARQGRARFPNDVDILVAHARALAALKRTSELANELEGISYDAIVAPLFTLTSAFDFLILELRAHGYPELAEQFAGRLLQQLDGMAHREPKEHLDEVRVGLLSAAHRWEEAAPILEKLSAQQPDHDALVNLRAELAAARGQPEVAERLALEARSLALAYENQDLPGRRAAERRYLLNLAAIRAISGKKESAVEILKSSAADHRTPDLLHLWSGSQALADYPPFVEFANRHYDDPDVLPVAVAETSPKTPWRARWLPKR